MVPNTAFFLDTVPWKYDMLEIAILLNDFYGIY